MPHGAAEVQSPLLRDLPQETTTDEIEAGNDEYSQRHFPKPVLIHFVLNSEADRKPKKRGDQ